MDGFVIKVFLAKDWDEPNRYACVSVNCLCAGVGATMLKMKTSAEVCVSPQCIVPAKVIRR